MSKCEGHGAVVHRRALVMGQHSEKQLQQLDPEGCSGHLSFILHLLEDESFRRDYLQGNWNWKDFRDMIESYELVLHKGGAAPG